jgi:alpha-1,6-mannosyltransferase
MFWGPAGGVRRVLSRKQALMPLHGWRHTVLAPGVRGPGFVDCGGPRLPLSGGEHRVVLDRWGAERLIQGCQPDLVEAGDPFTLAWASLRASARLRVPAVAFCHLNLPSLAARLVGGTQGAATGRGRWAARRARDYLTRLYSHFELVMAPSRGLAERLRAWGVPRVVVQPLGVDCSVFKPEAADYAWRLRLCRRLGLSEDTRLLVYTGRFAIEKNLQLLAEAVQLLGKSYALLAVGAGPRPPKGPQVFVLSPEHDSARLARLVASCDVYVHAGNQETFGLGVLEAMACGTPVVVSESGALGELAHEAGLSVPRPRAQEWAEILRAVDDGVWPLCANALRRAREHDWQLIIEQLSRRYLRLLAHSSVGPEAEWGAPTEPGAWITASATPASAAACGET